MKKWLAVLLQPYLPAVQDLRPGHRTQAAGWAHWLTEPHACKLSHYLIWPSAWLSRHAHPPLSDTILCLHRQKRTFIAGFLS